MAKCACHWFLPQMSTLLPRGSLARQGSASRRQHLCPRVHEAHCRPRRWQLFGTLFNN